MSEQLEGMRELMMKLEQIDAAVAVKELRSAALQSTTPTLKKMKLAIPVGSDVHRTYMGRLVAPGFAKRSIKRSTKIEKGKIVVRIGVKREAFYAVSFLDPGTKKMSAHPWFKSVFEGNKSNIEGRFRDVLKKKIERIARK
jgi:HK97 gp10 family phage protein